MKKREIQKVQRYGPEPQKFQTAQFTDFQI